MRYNYVYFIQYISGAGVCGLRARVCGIFMIAAELINLCATTENDNFVFLLLKIKKYEEFIFSSIDAGCALFCSYAVHVSRWNKWVQPLK